MKLTVRLKFVSIRTQLVTSVNNFTVKTTWDKMIDFGADHLFSQW